MELFRSTFLIARENLESAADAVVKAGLAEEHRPKIVIADALRNAGLFFAFADKGCEVLDCEEWMAEEVIDFMEKVFKTISRSVEPGSYIEFIDGETLVRYMFLYDTVERWTVPTVLYAKKEVI